MDLLAPMASLESLSSFFSSRSCFGSSALFRRGGLINSHRRSRGDPMEYQCGQRFIFIAGKQAFYAEHGFAAPKRCHTCRAARRQQQPSRQGRRLALY